MLIYSLYISFCPIIIMRNVFLPKERCVHRWGELAEAELWLVLSKLTVLTLFVTAQCPGAI